jgi:regulator of RNase E activity RraA
MTTEEKFGFRIFTKINRIPREQFEMLMEVTTGNVCDAMDRFGAMDYQIKPIDPSMKCIGTAITVKARPCDNLIVYKALEIAQSGDVIVIGIYNYTSNSTWGDLTSLIAKKKGLAGMVTDGLVRDALGIKKVGLPVFSRGSVPTSPFKDGPGEINVPITCGGVFVRPGDIIFGDIDGVVVIPQENVLQVVRKALEIAREEEKKIEDIHSGHLIPEWVEKTLRERGYVIE